MWKLHVNAHLTVEHRLCVGSTQGRQDLGSHVRQPDACPQGSKRTWRPLRSWRPGVVSPLVPSPLWWGPRQPGNSLTSPWSGAGCQPDRSAGTRAAGGPRGSQVRGGRLLPAPGGAAPPAVPQVSQPAGGPRPGSPCNPLLSPRRVGGQSRLQKAGTARVSQHHSRSSPLSEAVCLSRKL